MARGWIDVLFHVPLPRPPKHEKEKNTKLAFTRRRVYCSLLWSKRRALVVVLEPMGAAFSFFSQFDEKAASRVSSSLPRSTYKRLLVSVVPSGSLSFSR